MADFRRIDPSALDRDPFWSQVRRRHPDVDIVLLPPEPADVPTPPEPGPPAGTEEVRAAAAETIAAWRQVAEVLEPTRPPAVSWSRSETGDALTIQLGLQIDQEAGTDLLGRLMVGLGQRGWLLAPATRDGKPLLRAKTETGEADLTALAGARSTLVTVEGRSLPTSDADRSRVAAEAMDEVSA